MEFDAERRKTLIRLADDILTQIKNKGFTGFEGDIDDETWEIAFVEELHPILDEAIAGYKLSPLDLFYMGVWFGSQSYSIG